MSLTEQPAAYNDCLLVWQKAVDTPGGIRFYFSTYNEASTFQMRMNKCRSIQRRLSRKTNSPNSPAYDTSEFDGHMVQVPKEPDTEGHWWVYVRPHGKLSILDRIEPISETEPEVLDELATVQRLEAEREAILEARLNAATSPTDLRRLTHAHTQATTDDLDAGIDDPDRDLE